MCTVRDLSKYNVDLRELEEDDSKQARYRRWQEEVHRQRYEIQQTERKAKIQAASDHGEEALAKLEDEIVKEQQQEGDGELPPAYEKVESGYRR